jgi:hypothetical protein
MADRGTDQTVTLVNDAALSLLSKGDMALEATQLIVVGTSPVRMALAEVAFPDAAVICADLGQSAALAKLDEKVRAFGRLDRLVLAADGADSAAIFTLMRVIVTFVPALRDGPNSSIHLEIEPGSSVVALRQFLRRMQPTMERHSIAVTLVVSTVLAS